VRTVAIGSRLRLQETEEGGDWVAAVLEQPSSDSLLVEIVPPLEKSEVEFYAPKRGATWPVDPAKALLVDSTRQWPWNHVFDVPWRCEMFLVPLTEPILPDKLVKWGSVSVTLLPVE
jgi:hypothetical protein